MLIFFTLCDFNENFVKSHFYCVVLRVDFTKYFSNENKPLIVLICNVFLSYLEVDGFSADWALLIDVRCLLWGDEITEFSLTQSASFSSWRVESLRDDRLKSSKSKLSSSAALKTQKKNCFVLILKTRALKSQLLRSYQGVKLRARA